MGWVGVCRGQTVSLPRRDGGDEDDGGGDGGVYLYGRLETSFNDPCSQTIAVGREITLAATKMNLAMFELSATKWRA